MDKTLIRERFARAAATYEGEASVQRKVARRLAGLVGRYVPSEAHARVWEAGCGTGLFTRLYLSEHRPSELWLNDLCAEVEGTLRPLLDGHTRFVAGDAETVPLPAGLTLVTSCSAVQWFDSPQGFLGRCREALAEGGCVALATYGEGNMHEVRSLAGEGLPYLSLAEWEAEAGRLGFRVLYGGEERCRLTFAGPEEVLGHMRRTGVTGISRRHRTCGQLREFCRRYRERFGTEEGRVALTYHPVYVLIQKTYSL